METRNVSKRRRNSYKRCYHNTIFPSLRFGIFPLPPTPVRNALCSCNMRHRKRRKKNFSFTIRIENENGSERKGKIKVKGWLWRAPTQRQPPPDSMMTEGGRESEIERGPSHPPTTFSVQQRKLKMSSRIDFPIPHRPKHFFRFAFSGEGVAMCSLRPCLARFLLPRAFEGLIVFAQARMKRKALEVTVRGRRVRGSESSFVLSCSIKLQFRVSVAGCSVRIKNFLFPLPPSAHTTVVRVRASSRMG